MIRIGSIVLRVDDLERQTAFWMAALDYLPREEASDDFVLLRPRNGVGPNVSLDRHCSTLQLPPRIHLDLYGRRSGDLAVPLRRFVTVEETARLGAFPVPAEANLMILADSR